MAPGDRPRAGSTSRADVSGAADGRGPGRSEPERRERSERRTARHVRPCGPRIPGAPERTVLLPATAETTFALAAPDDGEETGRGPPRGLGPRALRHGGCPLPAAPKGAQGLPRPVPSARVRGVQLSVRRRGQGSHFPFRVRRGLAAAGVASPGPPGVGEERERIPR